MRAQQLSGLVSLSAAGHAWSQPYEFVREQGAALGLDYLARRDEEIRAGAQAKPSDALCVTCEVPDVLVVMQRMIPDSMIPPLHHQAKTFVSTAQ